MEKPSWDKPKKVAGMWTRGGRRPSRREVERDDVIYGHRRIPASSSAVDPPTHQLLTPISSKESSIIEAMTAPSSGTAASPPMTPVIVKPTVIPPKTFKTPSREKFEEGLKEKLRESVVWEKPPPAPTTAPMGKRVRPRVPVELDETGEVIEPRREVWTFPVRGPRSRSSVPAATGSARDVARRVEETTREFREWAREAADRTVEKSEQGRRAYLAQKNAALALASRSNPAPKSKDPSKADFLSEVFSVQPVAIKEVPKPSPRQPLRQPLHPPHVQKKEKKKDVKAQIQAIFKAMPPLEEKEEGAEPKGAERVVIRMTSPERKSRTASDADHSSIASTLSPFSSPPTSPIPEAAPQDDFEIEIKNPELEKPRTLAQILEQFDLGSKTVTNKTAVVIPSTPMDSHPERPGSRGVTPEAFRKLEEKTSAKEGLITPDSPQKLSSRPETPNKNENVPRTAEDGHRVLRDSMRVLEESRRVLSETPRWQREFYLKTEEVPDINVHMFSAIEEIPPTEETIDVSPRNTSTLKSPTNEAALRTTPKVSPRRHSVDAKPRTPNVPKRPAPPVKPRNPTKPVTPGSIPAPRVSGSPEKGNRAGRTSMSSKHNAEKITETTTSREVSQSPIKLLSPAEKRIIKPETSTDVEIHEVEPEVKMLVPQGSGSLPTTVGEIVSAVVVERDISSKSGGVDIFGQGTKKFIRHGTSKEVNITPTDQSRTSPDQSVRGVVRRGGPQAFEEWVEAFGDQGHMASAVVLEEPSKESDVTGEPPDSAQHVSGNETMEVALMDDDQISQFVMLNPYNEFSDEGEEVEVKKRGKPKWFKEYGIGTDDSEGEMSEEEIEELSEQDIEKEISSVVHDIVPSEIGGESGMSIEIEEKSSSSSVCRSVEEDTVKEEAKSIDIVMASTMPLIQAEQVLEPVDDLKLQMEDTTQYSDYLKSTVGRYLVRGLVQVLIYKPEDPIDYLAHWLHADRDKEDRAAAVHEARTRLQEMRDFVNLERQQATLQDQALSYFATAGPPCVDPDMMGYGEEESESDIQKELETYKSELITGQAVS